MEIQHTTFPDDLLHSGVNFGCDFLGVLNGLSGVKLALEVM